MTAVCRYCGRFFHDPVKLSEHEHIHRQEDIATRSVNDQIVNSWNTLRDDGQQQQQPATSTLAEAWDEEFVEYNDKRDFHCDSCNKIYESRSALVRHKTSKHSQAEFVCLKCRKCFNRFDNKARHEKTCKGVNTEHKSSSQQSQNDLFCSKCKKRFTRFANLSKHKKTCLGSDHVCPECDKRCSTAHGLRRHIQWHDKAPARTTKGTENDKPSSPKPITPPPQSDTGPRQYRCRRCADHFANRQNLYLHGMRHHYQTGGGLQELPWGDNEPTPWIMEDGSVNEGLQEVYEANSPLILQEHRPGPVQSVYNFPLTNDVSVEQLMRYASVIYDQQPGAYRINLTFGVILQNRETEHYRYFVPYDNSGVLDRPFYISKRDDLRRLRLRLSTMDITQELLTIRPNTKWVPILVSNIHFTVYSTSYPLGNGDLPDYLLRKDSLYPLVKNRQNGKLYTDNLCAFRCLSLHRGHDIRCIDGPANQLYQLWLAHTICDFRGLQLEEFPEFETLFCFNLEVYSLQEDGFARSIYKSRGQHETTMYVNLHDNHLSYIQDFSMYAQKYRCKTCDRHFKRPSDLHQHQRSCANQTKYIYPGGFHHAQEGIFEKLDQFDIHVQQDQRSFPWFMCYDFEAMLHKVNERPTDMLQWTQKHVPISVCICSNVEGHVEPVCIIEPDQDKLVQRMVSSLRNIAERVHELAEEKWAWVLEAINKKLEEEKKKEEKEDLCDEDDDDNGLVDDDADADDDSRKDTGKATMFNHPLTRLYGQMEGYIAQIPVLGFNSAKYDLNLVKRCLAKHLNMHDTNNFVVKNNNAYMCIATEQLKFLDMSQFLAAGSSYAGFLKAYHVNESKGFFPYEWFDDVTKLETTSLPSHEAFYSSLKATNITAEDYTYCQKIWKDNKMASFRDFLIWYNDRDVAPFVVAIERFQKFYFDKDIDVFKTAISVPGIARQLLFRAARDQNANFALFDEQNEDLYHTVKQNIVGGPSIIFTRQHCAGKTRIRGNKPCGSILGFDANALYLQAIGKDMPVGPFVRRRAENDFRPEVRDKYMAAYYWMDWLTHTQGTVIQHMLNHGKEIRIGPYPVDGFSPAPSAPTKSTCYQFHGCYWHGHLCCVTRNVKDDKWLASRLTLETTQYLRQEGYQVIEMWECDFRRYCSQNPQIYQFIDSKRPGFFQHHKGAITENHILEGVVQERLFGMVEVDIEVPECWPGYFQHPTLTPYEYYQEMSPLFCNTAVSFDDIGEHMQDHVERHNLSKAPRRLLLGGMKARQILLATPLLKWYLDHGMVVTKIYQLVEFQQQRCFSRFVEEVSEARRTGDRDPDTAIIADTSKVIGNAGYGSLIMDQTKHRDIKYVQGENKTCLKINEPRFRKLECLDQEEQYYEVEMAKRIIKLNLPIQLGYMILQYAKLRMLEFYYDFMDVYVDRQDFEYCEMDTDSAYMAISGQRLADVIKPEMKVQYQEGLEGFCTDADVEADAHYHWFPRTCCSKHAKYDKRTPGLFKLEYQGEEIIGLCSKTYIVRKAKTLGPSSARIVAYKLLRRCLQKKVKRCPYKARFVQEYKFSSKGVSNRTVKAPMTKFRRVLKNSKAEGGHNRGFRVRNNAIFTYTQERRGFSYFYCKRRVLADGIHTAPLDITLCPVPQPEVDDQELVDILVELQ